MMAVDMNKIPEPFREFLANEGQEKEIRATSIEDAETDAHSRSKGDMHDLLFLAAILMLTDE